MGLTTSDRNKIMYSEWRISGLSHDEALNKIPIHLRERFIKDIAKSNIESHFGVKDKTFFVIIGSMIVGFIIFILL